MNFPAEELAKILAAFAVVRRQRTYIDGAECASQIIKGKTFRIEAVPFRKRCKLSFADSLCMPKQTYSI